MNTSKRHPVSKFLASTLCAALILLSPGVPCYQVLAAGFETATGAQAFSIDASPMGSFAAPESIARFGGMVVNGVNVSELLTNVAAAAKNFPDARAALEPISQQIKTLSANPTPEEKKAAVDAVTSYAAGVRRSANSFVGEAAGEISGGQSLSPEQQERMAQLNAVRFLLDDSAQKNISNIESRDKELRIAALEHGADGWRKSVAESGGDKVGQYAESLNRGGALMPAFLLESNAAERPASLTPAVARAKFSVQSVSAMLQDGKWKKPLGVFLGIGAAATLALTHGAALTLPIIAGTGALVFHVLAHQVGHLWVGKRLGDNTATRFGEDSLNPFAHADFLGTFLAPLSSLIMTSAYLPVAMPVAWTGHPHFDFNKIPRKDWWKVGLAGSAVNIALAAGAIVALHLMPGSGVLATTILKSFYTWGVGLAVFNLGAIFLPNSDGVKVLASLLPEKTFRNWFAYDPEFGNGAYQRIFQRNFQGPSLALNFLRRWGLNPRQVQGLTWGLEIAAFAGVFSLAHAFLGIPFVPIMLACSQAYYCIFEHVQNEEAVKSLRGVFHGFGVDALQYGNFNSDFTAEEFDTALAEVVDGGLIDEIVASEDFEGLSPDERWDRVQKEFVKRGVDALHRKVLTDDSPEDILKKGFESQWGQKRLEELRAWFEAEWDGKNIYARWAETAKKAQEKDKKTVNVGQVAKNLGVLALIIGASFFGGHHALLAGGLPLAMMMGDTVNVASSENQENKEAVPAPHKSFNQLIEEKEQIPPKIKAMLQSLLTDMETKKYAHPIIGRQKEIGEIYKVVTGPRSSVDSNSAVMVADAGVGKTAAAEGLAQAMILSRTRPAGDTFKLAKLEDRYLVSLNVSRLLISGDPVATFDMILSLLSSFNDPDPKKGNKVILFMDEFHKLKETPAGQLVLELMKEPLARGEVSIITATTTKEFKEYIRPDEALSRRFIMVPLPEFTPEQTLRVLRETRAADDGMNDVKTTDTADKAAVYNSKADQELHLPGRAFRYRGLAAREVNYESRRDRFSMAIVDKINDLKYAIEQLLEIKNMAEGEQKQDPAVIEHLNNMGLASTAIIDLYRQHAAVPTEGIPVVSEDLVNEQIVKRTGKLTLAQEDMSKYTQMESILNDLVIGQKEAVRAVVDAVIQNKAGLSSPNKPIAVFYWVGPTGVGKSELALQLANYLQMKLHRFDMSEYQEKHTVSRLLGAPPGYVGHDAGGQLTEAVRDNPYSVVLLDEIEKAHPDVFNPLINATGEGARMTDGQGHTVFFNNTIVIMTSNLAMEVVNEILNWYMGEFKALNAKADAVKDNPEELAKVQEQMRELDFKKAAKVKSEAQKAVDAAMKNVFRPEFKNRFTVPASASADSPAVIFNDITPDMAPRIVELRLNDYLAKALSFFGHEIEKTKDVVPYIAREGFDARGGARALGRKIEQILGVPIGKIIVKDAENNGSKIRPLHFKLAVENGELKITAAPVEVKLMAKQPPTETAALEFFNRIFTDLKIAAEEDSTYGLELDNIEAWVKELLAAHPAADGSEPAAAPQPVAAPAAQAAAPAPAPASAKPQGPSLLEANKPVAFEPNAEALVPASGESPKAFLERTSQGVAAALQQAGYSADVQEVVLKAIPGANDSYETGWLKLFLKRARAKSQPQTEPIQARYQVDAQSVKIVVHRSGAMDDMEKRFLERHFTGAVAADAGQAREKADMGNSMMMESSADYYNLYRALSAIPGAKIGYTTGATGTDYWIEIPKGQAANSSSQSSGQ